MPSWQSHDYMVHPTKNQPSCLGPSILNEKAPPPGKPVVEASRSHRRWIVSERVFAVRSYPDYHIARRALIILRLAEVISERKVQDGLGWCY